MVAQYKKGDKVEYRPIGGDSDNVSHSSGQIQEVFEDEKGDVKYAITNDNTGKTTNYLEMNIVGKSKYFTRSSVQ